MIPGISEERILEVIRLVGLENRINEKVQKYSLGMRQRLGIAQALLHRPSILILDEPTNGLDPSGIREIRQYIRELAEKENVSVIVSSHLLSEVEMTCDRIGIIKNGELIAIESISEALEQTDIKEIHIEANPIQKTKDLLNTMVESPVHMKEDNLVFMGKKEAVPTFVQNLVQKDIKVYGVYTRRASLEDKFFGLIEEDDVVE